MRHKILLHTNFPLIKSGLAENGRILAKWLDQTGKYDIVYLGSQAAENHTDIPKMPYKTLGVIPANPLEQEALKRDFFNWRDTCYGGRSLHKIIEREKPTIWWGSDDIWAFQPHVYNAEWFKKINTVFHITVDSVPISKMAYEQAASTPNYVTWAKFAQNEMIRNGAKNVLQIYGASETSKFKPISLKEKNELRAKHNISPDTVIFIYLGRNQLRKEFGNAIAAFAEFKKENPHANAKLLFHTSFAESGAGWDIPKLINYYNVPNDDVLTTMFCRQCGEWEIKAYQGENTDCRFCNTGKSQVSCTIAHGVEHDELHLVYGIADAAISPFTSGGLEFHNVNSLLCGLPLACTNYSCGEDFCEQPFVYPIKWHTRFEHQTTYKKATNDVNSIKNFMSIMYKKTYDERRTEGEIGRDWAVKTFSIESIGPQWEKLFDSMPHPDWSQIDLTPKFKNPDYPMPTVEDNVAWVKELYRGILDLNVQDDDKGVRDWLESLRIGRSRQSIYNYFINEARKENARLKPNNDLETLFDHTPGRKKLLLVMKESGGDIFIGQALLPKLKELYPDADIYWASDEKFHELLDGNEYIYKVLKYIPEMENELLMMRYVDYFYFPALATQRQLNYLTHDKIGLEL